MRDSLSRDRMLGPLLRVLADDFSRLPISSNSAPGRPSSLYRRCKWELGNRWGLQNC